MNMYQYRKVDAFTSQHSMGNPAACIYLKDDRTLSPEEMQFIARQHKGFVSEMVYCRAEKPSGFSLVYYSSECEVDFCGHGTIACMYSLLKNMPELISQKEIPLQTHKKGGLTLYNEIPTQDAVYISAPALVCIEKTWDTAAVAEALRIAPDDMSDALPITAMDAGLRTLLVPIRHLQTNIAIEPDQETLRQFCMVQEIDIVLVFSMETADPGHFAHTRVFAPKFGYLEDPATGSGSSAFGYYLKTQGLWDGTPIALEQGGAEIVYNTVRLKGLGDRVLFGGRAALRIEGMYYL